MPHRARVGLAQRLLPDDEIVSMYLSGVDAESVGYRAGCSAGTVLKIVKSAGHQSRGRGGVKNMQLGRLPPDELVRLYESGLSMEKIAETAGCSLHMVRKTLLAAGTRIRPPGERFMRKVKSGCSPRKFTRSQDRG